ncbi:dienelactone hydrolase family protein [Solimonas sp. K1W22B-7]|uniref:Dienelactone hydrolase family protein n=2 Tax=Solimonas sp. K1W22B-7 TaxID=2303331 RepID=A0ACD6B926_9GAMM|nr:dienelactone hydrolase family protein [Solimonas sp. K1W22B-7]AXQ28503.1 dienelactone hydrolase family protein [Solimonas sp. K1W22B-7]
MRKQKIEYGNGPTQFHGWLIRDDSLDGVRPGVLVFPEAYGLNEHAIERAERLAQLGYVALAADMHGGGVVYSDTATLGPAIRSLFGDRAEWRARAQAALDALLAQPQVDRDRVAAIGFCFGGATCLELARSGAPLSALVTFHAGLQPPLEADAGRITGKVLICHGAEDPLMKPEALNAVLAELSRDRVDWQLLSFGGVAHSFTNPDADARGAPGFAYNANADRRSWAAMQGLFAEVFAN